MVAQPKGKPTSAGGMGVGGLDHETARTNAMSVPGGMGGGLG